MKYFINFFKANPDVGIFAMATNEGVYPLRDHLTGKDAPLVWGSFGDRSNPKERQCVIEGVQFTTRAALIAVKNFNILRMQLTHQLETTQKALSKKDVSIQEEGVLSFFNTNEGCAVSFLRCILEFPRFKVKSCIELGGLPYLNAIACQTYHESWPDQHRDAIPPALLFAMQHGKLGVPPPEITDPAERQSIVTKWNRLMFDEGLQTFKKLILELSRFAGKDVLKAGIKLTGALDRLVEGLESLDIDNFARIDHLVESVLQSMSDLCAELSVAPMNDNIKSDIEFLVNDVKARRKANSTRGKINRTAGFAETDPEAAQRREDLKVAIRMVDERVHRKNESIIDACDHVIKHFKLASPKKDKLGEAQYYPLQGERGPIKPATLARYYRAHKAKKSAKQADEADEAKLLIRNPIIF